MSDILNSCTCWCVSIFNRRVASRPVIGWRLPSQQLHTDNRWVWRRPSGHMTAAVFHMHAGDNCWHCYRLRYPRRPYHDEREAGAERWYSCVCVCVCVVGSSGSVCGQPDWVVCQRIVDSSGLRQPLRCRSPSHAGRPNHARSYGPITIAIRARFEYDSSTPRESVVGVSCMLIDSSMHTIFTLYLYRPTLHRVREYARNCLYKRN